MGSRGRCRLLGVFAHPDDETFCAGGTFARYAGQGAEIMVVSATRGQAGQIRDAAVGNRRTIAAVREAELRLACERLGIAKVRCLDHVDGTLADVAFSTLADEIAEVICEFRPDAVITFGPDGGYGHPDHITISAVTTAACQRAADPGRPRLYYRCFPSGDLLILERLATWLASQPDRFAGTTDFAHAFLLLAEASGTMRHIRDHVQVRWYPSGSYVVEQGEAAAELFLILSGEADVWQESSDGHRRHLRRMGVGEFFGELGIAGNRRRSADMVAAASLTCLVLSPAPPTKFAGRGEGARLADARPGAWANTSPASRNLRAGQGIISCDVSEQVMRKVEALSAYRSQFPLEPDMFPAFLLQEMFGREYFVASFPDHLDATRNGGIPMKIPAVFYNAKSFRDVPAGAIIFEEGASGAEMFGILEGDVEVRLPNGAVRRLGPDDTFGEMAIVDTAPRSATAVAVTDTKLAVIDRARFLFLVQETPMFALQVMSSLAERLRAADGS